MTSPPEAQTDPADATTGTVPAGSQPPGPAASGPLTPEQLTAAEAARALGLSTARVRQLARDGRLDVVATGPLRLSGDSVLEQQQARAARSETETEVPEARAQPSTEAEAAEDSAAARPEPVLRWDGRARKWVPAR